jgi:metal-dependent amidase/aminoacylase/carboxypeptidase family protein
LGTGNPEKGINAPLHSSHFMVDEEALKTGMSTMGWLTIKFLKQPNE